jgi:predicted neuraminidase
MKHGPVVGPPAAALANAAGTNGIIQPIVIEVKPGHLRLYARATENIGHIVASDSVDDGVTWSGTHALALPNPNSGIDAVKLRDGREVMIYNDTDHGRTPLNLAVSKDGEHFRNFATLESAPGEYSYPSIVQEHDGSLAATYTWQRTRIRFAHIPMSAVPAQ